VSGAHDLGGKIGLGRIAPERENEEPVFHGEWERRVFALTLATGMLGKWNIDESRFARERQSTATYLGNTYYENWLAGMTTLLSEKDLLNQPAATLRRPTPDDALRILASGGPTLMDDKKPPRFAVGTEVRVRISRSSGHTRVPQYAQGAIGVIAALRGSHVFPDQHIGQEAVAEPLYSVRFSASALWANSTDNTDVMIDLWEPYLELANQHD